MKSLVIRFVLISSLSLCMSTQAADAAPEGRSEAPAGTMTWGVHVTLAARWLDPSDTEAFITPFMVLYALHDALTFQTVWQPLPGWL